MSKKLPNKWRFEVSALSSYSMKLFQKLVERFFIKNLPHLANSNVFLLRRSAYSVHIKKNTHKAHKRSFRNQNKST